MGEFGFCLVFVNLSRLSLILKQSLIPSISLESLWYFRGVGFAKFQSLFYHLPENALS